MTEQTLEQLLRAIRQDSGVAPLTIKPTKIIWRPEDVRRSAAAHGITEQAMIDSLLALGATYE